MKSSRSLGIACLAVYLILIGVLSLFGINLGVLSFLTPALALLAGVLLLVGK